MNLIEAEQLALRLMEEFGLLPAWTFKWDNARRRFGVCRYNKKIISLSRHLVKLNDREQVEDTIRHEIAHALDAETRGRTDHSIHWKRWAVKCGARPERCYSSKEVDMPEAPLFAFCPNCRLCLPRFRKMKKNRIYTCGRCSKSHNPDYTIIPDIPSDRQEKLVSGELAWQTLPQARQMAQLLKQRGWKGLFLRRYSEHLL